MVRFEMNGGRYVIVPEPEYMKLKLASLKGSRVEADEEVWGRKEICQYLGISRSCLSESPWILPYFGAGMIGKRNARWFKSEVVLWLSRPIAELKEEYLARNRHEDNE